MVSKIIFLGTGGDSFVIGKQIRNAGGIILKVDDLQFHIDPGPGALINAVHNHISIRENTAVFVSSSNINQCNDVNVIIDAMTYGGMDKRGVLVANKTIVNGTETIKPFLTEAHKNYLERIIVLNEGQKLAIEDVEIDAISTNNTSDPNTIGFKFYTPDFVMGYTSTTAYSKELVKAYHGCDILIINVQNPGEEKGENSLNTEEARKLVTKINPKLAILTYFGIRMIKADPLYEAREIQKTTGIQVLAAKDGMVIIPSSYSAKSSQKRLNLFKVKEEIVKDNIKSKEIKVEANVEEKKSEEEKPIEITEVEEEKKEEFDAGQEGIVNEESYEHKEEQTHLDLNQEF
jgi:ribonuclease BN (tRNA processing enzyme)